MKVAYLTSFYNGKIDGRLGRFHDWVHQLRDMENPPFEHEIHAFSAVNPDNTLASKPYSFLGDGNQIWGTRTNNVEFLCNVPRVYTDLQRSDFDILHILHLNPVVYPTGISNQDCPVVIGPDILGWNPVRSGGRWNVQFPNSLLPRFKYEIKRAQIRLHRYHVVTAYSQYHHHILTELGVSEEEITPIPPGIAPIFCKQEEGTSRSKTPELLYVGDFSKHKGFPEFIRAIKRIDRDIDVTVVGAGNPGKEVKRLEQIQIEGFIERSKLPKYYQRADLYIMPSIDEAGPNTIIEALACGTPVVVTDKIGINEFPPSDAAVLFWPREPDSLASAIKKALDKLPQLRAAAHAHAEEFHVNHTIQKLDEIYRELLDDYPCE